MKKDVLLLKLCHLLGVEPEDFVFLKELSKDDLTKLHAQINHQLSDGQTDIWEKLAKVSQFVPAFVTAKVAQTVMGEVVCANVTSHMKIKESLKVMKHLSTDFLAKVSTHLIPEQNAELLNAIPLKTLKKVSSKLIDKQEYYTLANFVETIELQSVLSIADEIKKESDLLHISAFIENKSRVAEIIRKFSDKRLGKIILRAYEIGYRDEIFEAFEELNSEDMKRVLNIAIKFPEEVKEKITDDLNRHFNIK